MRSNSVQFIYILFATFCVGCSSNTPPNQVSAPSSSSNANTPPVTSKAENAIVVTISPEERFIQQATDILIPKSKTGSFRVLQSMPDGALCTWGERDVLLGEYFYTGETFFWIDSSNLTVADGDKLRKHLYWCGTYTYQTVKGVESTVHAYTVDKDDAISLVRYQFGLFTPSEETAVVHGSQENSDTSTWRTIGSGTGFFVTNDGYIVTCYHVVKDADSLLTLDHADNVDVASLVAFDQESDLALLKINRDSKPVAFSQSGDASLGQSVLTIGFPAPEIQGRAAKVTKGVVSSLTGPQNDIRTLQTDAAVQPGNSGGPLLTETGRVVGVVNAQIDPALFQNAAGTSSQNVNYAIRRDFVLAFLQDQPGLASRLVTIGTDFQTVEETVKNLLPSIVLVAAITVD